MQYLLDSKKEYTNIILDNITAPICNSIYNMFKSSNNNIKDFQTKLANIRNWNSYNIDEYYISIMKLCKIKNLSQILNQIIILDIQLKTEKKNININNIKFINIEDFIYKCIVNASIYCWKNAYLFAQKNLKPSEKQYHLNIIEKNIKKIIKSTIRDSTPFELVFDNNLFSPNLDPERKTVVSNTQHQIEKNFDDFDINDKPVEKIILEEEYQSDGSDIKSPIPQKKILKYNDDNQKSSDDSDENVKNEVSSNEEESDVEESDEEESEDEDSEEDESEDEEINVKKEIKKSSDVSVKKQVNESSEEEEVSVKKQVNESSEEEEVNVKKQVIESSEEEEVNVKKQVIESSDEEEVIESSEEEEVNVKKQVKKPINEINKKKVVNQSSNDKKVSIKKQVIDSSEEETNAKIVPEIKSLLNDDISIYASENESDIPKTPINSKIKVRKDILNAPTKKKTFFKANSSSEDEEKNSLYKSSSESSDDDESNYNSEIRTIKINTSVGKNRKRYYS